MKNNLSYFVSRMMTEPTYSVLSTRYLEDGKYALDIAPSTLIAPRLTWLASFLSKVWPWYYRLLDQAGVFLKITNLPAGAILHVSPGTYYVAAHRRSTGMVDRWYYIAWGALPKDCSDDSCIYLGRITTQEPPHAA